jgi:hypothetical protein
MPSMRGPVPKTCRTQSRFPDATPASLLDLSLTANLPSEGMADIR